MTGTFMAAPAPRSLRQSAAVPEAACQQYRGILGEVAEVKLQRDTICRVSRAPSLVAENLEIGNIPDVPLSSGQREHFRVQLFLLHAEMLQREIRLSSTNGIRQEPGQGSVIVKNRSKQDHFYAAPL